MSVCRHNVHPMVATFHGVDPSRLTPTQPPKAHQLVACPQEWRHIRVMPHKFCHSLKHAWCIIVDKVILGQGGAGGGEGTASHWWGRGRLLRCQGWF